ncbi:MAG: dTDP-4-dehydrorhamnose 3,5-epimerase [Geminicoccaceae bacterium]|nr:dTDP-4-dehydrorhamnose 3,5-epimerase [Geminicoccaceae bacterium]
MRVLDEPLPGVRILELPISRDERGFFARAYCRDGLAGLGVDFPIVQANVSASPRPGTLRGLHYQLPPSAETKLVRCLSGAVWDCVLDLRPRSPTFGRWVGYELSVHNHRAILVPPGCAHGFLTLEPDALVLYFVSAAYDPRRERGVRWNDPNFAIAWPFPPSLVSPRDRAHPDFDPSYHLNVDRRENAPCAPS